MRTISIRSFLAILAATIAIPAIAFGVLLFVELSRSEQTALENRTARDVSALASAVDLLLEDMVSTLNLVSSAPELQSGDFAEFHFRTRLALEDSGKFVIVADGDGQQLLNTRVDFGTPLGKTSDMESLKQALATGSVVISNVFLGQTSGRYVFNVIRPLPRFENSAARALIITRNASEIGDALGSLDLPAGWNVAVVDQARTLVAGSAAIGAPIGTPLELASSNSDLLIHGLSRDASKQELLAYSKVPVSGWYVFKWGPVSTARVSVLTSWQALLASGLVMLTVIAVGLVFWEERLRIAVSRLARMAEAVGEGQVVSPERSFITEIDVVALRLSEASFDRSQAEERAELVMRELAHRTKNLMSVVVSMIRQTARHSKTVKEMEQAIQNRVMALGSSVDLLTRSTLGRVSLRDVAETQLRTFDTASERTRIAGDDLLLKPDMAQQLGMAFHELATNSAKYGSLSVPNGKVHISWSIAPDAGEEFVHIGWIETGGPPVSAPKSKGFGQTIIKDYLESVTRGTVSLQYEAKGFRWSLKARVQMLLAGEEER